MNEVTWLHLSDWHQKEEELDRRVVLKELLKDIKEREKVDKRLKKIDLIFFTGDLAYHGTSQEYQKAKNIFLEPLMDVAEIGDIWHERLFIIPGNHDLDWNAFELQRSDLIKVMKNEDKVKEWLSHKRKCRTLMEPFTDYNEFIENYFGKHRSHGSVRPFVSFVRNVDILGRKIAVIGINSAWLSGRNKNNNGQANDYGSLKVGEPQLFDAIEQLKEANLAIALMHHPFEWLDTADRELVPSYLGKHCNFILLGHQHRAQVKIEYSTEGNYIIIPAGSCYNRRDCANGYNFVHMNTDSGQGIVYLRKWNDRRNCWQSDTDTIKEGKYPFNMPNVQVIPFQVSVAIMIKNKNVLLVRRKEKERGLWWQFPGGVIRTNQKDNKVAEREALKETGIVCKSIKKLGQRIHPDTHVIVHYWLCEYISGEPTVKDDKDLDRAEWINIKRALKTYLNSVYEPVKELLVKSQ